MSTKLNGVTSEKDSNIRIHCLRKPRSGEQFSNQIRARQTLRIAAAAFVSGWHVVRNLLMSGMQLSYLVLRWAEQNLASQ
jgi:hypothetical protein